MFFYDGRVELLTVGVPKVIVESFVEIPIVWLSDPFYGAKWGVFITDSGGLEISDFSFLELCLAIDVVRFNVKSLFLPSNILLWSSLWNEDVGVISTFIRDVAIWHGGEFKVIKYNYVIV